MNKYTMILKRQFKNHRNTTLVLIFGLIVSMILISFSTSTIYSQKIENDKNSKYMPKRAIKININFHKEFESTDINEWLSCISSTTGIYMDDKLVFLNDVGDGSMPVTAEYYNQIDKRFPLVEGEYYSKDDLRKGNKVVLIGKKYSQYIEGKDGNKNIYINNVKYQVKGVIGLENEDIEELDYKIVMPIKSLPESILKENIIKKEITFIMYDNKGDIINQYKILKDNISTFDSSANIQAIDIENDSSYMANNFNSNFILAVLIYLCSLINSLNISYYWINNRKQEIGIRKAFGETNFQIIRILFNEIFIICLLSSIISLSIQIIMGFFVEQVWKYKLMLSFNNIVVALGFVIISSVITIIVPSYKIIKMCPKESINI